MSKNMPSHTVWWGKPVDSSCSRMNRFSASLWMVRTSDLLAKGGHNMANVITCICQCVSVTGGNWTLYLHPLHSTPKFTPPLLYGSLRQVWLVVIGNIAPSEVWTPVSHMTGREADYNTKRCRYLFGVSSASSIFLSEWIEPAHVFC